jgi:PAS domain S-box-containing protein
MTTGRIGLALALVAGGVAVSWGNPALSFLAGGLAGIGLIVFAAIGSNSIIANADPARPAVDRDERPTGENQLRPKLPPAPDNSTETRYESADLLKVLLDNTPDLIYFKDCQSRFIRYSRAFREFLRLDETRTLAGKTDFDFFADAHARQAYEDEQTIVRTGKSIVDKIGKETHYDGRVTWTLTTKMPWRDSEGNIIGTFGVTRDITAMKEAETTLEETHKRLAHTSRMAGMAEVATDILHNVGNVLNSVNVSCSMVMERLQESPATNLARIPQMLRDQAGKLDAFLTTDPKGKKIPDYLGTLAKSIEEQRTFALGELNQLRRHIDHIKQVVAMQQNYAKVAGLEEQVEVGNLIEDALHINASALDRHRVELQRDLEPVPPLLVDKHKVLQILVNLVSNAKYAVSAVERPDKIMTVRIRRAGLDRIQIQIADNGIGIAPENLARVFAHGFTTRPDGHGFGLHSGALAAKELGGSLTVQSAGPGHGATFTLELPLKHSPPPANS